jgi:hypothetical protein
VRADGDATGPKREGEAGKTGWPARPAGDFRYGALP